MTFNKNTLRVVDMQVSNTIKFFSDFIDQDLVIWSACGAFYDIKKFNEIRFTKKNSLFTNEGIVLSGFDGCSTFAVECNKGFGFSVVNGNRNYWVDKINEKEVAVIVYKRKEED